MIAGVKSVDSSAKIIVNGTWKHIAFFQMLANGSQPDGSSDHQLGHYCVALVLELGRHDARLRQT